MNPKLDLAEKEALKMTPRETFSELVYYKVRRFLWCKLDP